MVSTFQVPGMGNLERRILEVNRKRVKVVKPGSKTSFPTTEVRGTYAPPFHVSISIFETLGFCSKYWYWAYTFAILFILPLYHGRKLVLAPRTPPKPTVLLLDPRFSCIPKCGLIITTLWLCEEGNEASREDLGARKTILCWYMFPHNVGLTRQTTN